jgi:hypothetical protein
VTDNGWELFARIKAEHERDVADKLAEFVDHLRRADMG